MRLLLSRLSRALAFAFLIAGGAASVHAQGAAPQPAGAPQAQETRFGLVIGNDGYDGAELPTAANDASLIADTLRTAGFDVTGARNLDQDTLRASYREFLAKVSAAGPSAVAAIYLSGYGLQYEGENYFVPVGAQINRESDIGLNAIRLSDLTRPLAGLQGNGSLVMLDLARRSPFLSGAQDLAPGLALMEPEPNTLISMNAAPGMLAPESKPPYGAYAQSIAEVVRVGGLTTTEIFDRVRLRTAELTRNTQTPWSASRLATPMVLLERAGNAPQAETAVDIDRLDTAAIPQMDEKQAYAAAIKRDNIKDYQAYAEAFPNSPNVRNVRSLAASRREVLTWQRTVAANVPNAYWSYLKRYPRGPHAADARRRLNRLQAQIEPPAVFDPYEYDVPPPPPEELTYFGDRGRYIDLEPVEVAEVVRPPRWWRPPPPPVFADDDEYFLPAPAPYDGMPEWIAPPAYVAEPILPYRDRSSSIAPYIAIPAALAAGIAVGKLMSRNKRNTVGTPFKPAVIPPTTLQSGRTHGRTFNTGFGATSRPIAPTVNRTLTTTQPNPLSRTTQPVNPAPLPTTQPVAPNPTQLRQLQVQQQREQANQLVNQQQIQRQQLLQRQREAAAQGTLSAAQKAQFERERAAQLRAQQAQTRQIQAEQQRAARQQQQQAAQQAAQQRAVQAKQERARALDQRQQQAAQQRVQARQEAERKALLQQQRANAAQASAAQRAQAQQQRAELLRQQRDQRARVMAAQQAQRQQAIQAQQQQRAMKLQQAAQQRAAQQQAIQAQRAQAMDLAAQRARAAAARAQRGCVPGKPCRP